jgi:hypothetical protein
MLSGYAIPSGFPSLLIEGKSIPLVYYSIGQLLMRGETASYSALEGNFTGKRRRNLNTQIGFTISRGNMGALGRFKPKGFGLSYFAIDWLEIQSSELPTSALICAGAPGPGMGRLRRRTDKLAQAITAWSEGNPIEADDEWSA